MLFHKGVKEPHILRKEDGLGVSDNRALRKIFEKKKEEGTGAWRKMYEELHNFYCLSHIIQMIK
jgi:hypothetical protein